MRSYDLTYRLVSLFLNFGVEGHGENENSKCGYGLSEYMRRVPSMRNQWKRNRI